MRRERERREDIIEDMVAEHFPNLGKVTDIQVQEVQRFPYSRGPQPLGHGPVLVRDLLGAGLHSRR